MECLYNCSAGGSDLTSWLQAIGGMLSVLVAAAVPTAIYVAEQRKSRGRERARAKCVLASAVDPLGHQLLALLNLWVEIRGADQTEHLLDEAIGETRVLKEIREALAVGHEFPTLANELVAFVMKLDSANAAAEATWNNAIDKWLDNKDPYELAEKIDGALAAGTELAGSIRTLMDS